MDEHGQDGIKEIRRRFKAILGLTRMLLSNANNLNIPGLICIEILTKPISNQSLKVLNKEVKSNFCQSLRVRLHANDVLYSKDL